MEDRPETTIVADVGARYGIHPSWAGFDAALHYIAFEPDPDEAARLRGLYESSPLLHYEVIEAALDRREGVRDFYLLKHRGLSSWLVPDLESDCFRHLKPGQAEIEKTIQIETRRLDDVFDGLGLTPDFLKIDTEGTEQDVIEGAARLFERGVLGVRASCNFQPCFVGQRLFSETHDFLMGEGFVLLNLDYKGFGYPRLGLFRKPDPTEAEDFRYGVLVAADGVWVRAPAALGKLFGGDARGFADLKLALFCMHNNAPDVGLDLARESRRQDRLTPAVTETRLYDALRLRAARFLGRWRTVPDDQWDKARDIYESIFKEELQGGSAFYPQIERISRDLGSRG